MKKHLIAGLLLFSLSLSLVPTAARAQAPVTNQSEYDQLIAMIFPVIMIAFPYICNPQPKPNETPEQAADREKVRQACQLGGIISPAAMAVLIQMYPEICQKYPATCTSLFAYLQSLGYGGMGGGFGFGTVGTGPQVGGPSGTVTTGPQAGGAGSLIDTGPQVAPIQVSQSTGDNCPSGIRTIQDVYKLVTCVLAGMVIPVIFILAFLVFLWGVVRFIRNGESVEGRKAGIQFMWYGLLSLFVMTSVWGIIRIATTTLGVDGTYIPKVQTPRSN